MKADERRLWREQAEALGWKHETVIGETTHAKLTDEERFEQAYHFAARNLAAEFRTAAVIDHEKLGRHAARGLIGAGIAGGPADIKRVVELIKERGIQIGGEHVSLVVGVFDDRLRVGVTLLNRTTRRVSLTGAGASLLGRFAPAMAEIEAAVQDTRDQRLKPRGSVRLHLPRAAYHSHVEPALGRLAEKLPEVALDLSVDGAVGDFAADGFDLIVRRGESVNTGLIAVPLGGDLRHVVVASPAYLAAQGTPQEPADLHDHRCIQWHRPDTNERYRWRFNIAGDDITLAVSGPLTASHCDVAIAAAIAGVGIAYVLEPLAAKSIADGRLAPLLQSKRRDGGTRYFAGLLRLPIRTADDEGV